MAKTINETPNEHSDQRFDDGEGNGSLLDLSQSNTTKPANKIRITIDVSQNLVNAIDRIRHQIGVDRGALIKVWLHERIQQELSHPRQY